MKKENFSIQLAIVDMLPVVLFGAAMAVLGRKLNSMIFTGGAVLCILSGCGKVLWKILLAVSRKDVKILGAQLRYVMPTGFLLMIIGAVMEHKAAAELLHAAVQMPSVLFFAAALLGIAGMVLCAVKFDRYDVRGNWIEQILNALAQGCVLAAVLLL